MSMEKITIDQFKTLASKYNLKPCKVKGTEQVNIRKNPNPRMVDIDFDEFEKLLKKKKLAVYKATESDFLKIMKA